MCNFDIAAAAVTATGAVVSGVNQANAADAQAGVANQNAEIAARNGARAADSILTVAGYNAAIDDNNALTVEYNAAAQAAAIRAASDYQEAQLRIQGGLIEQNAREAAAAARRAAVWDIDAVRRQVAYDTDTVIRNAGWSAAGLESDAGAIEAEAAGLLKLAEVDIDRDRSKVARVIGSARAALGKSGVVAEGSALDVLAETAAEGELDALMAQYRAVMATNESTRQAGQKRVAAGHAREEAQTYAIYKRREADVTTSRIAQDSAIEADNLEREGAVQAGMLRYEADMTRWQSDADIASLNHAATVQAGQLRNAAAWTRWQGEVDAGNARAGAATQSWQYRSQAEVIRAEGQNALVGGIFKAGTSLLSAAGDYTTQRSGYGSPRREETTGRMIGGT